MGLVGCHNGSKKDTSAPSPTPPASTNATGPSGTGPCSWLALQDAIRYSGAPAGATCQLKHEGHHEAYVGDQDHVLDWYIVKPGEEWDQNGQPIVVTSSNARQIIDGTRALESGLTSNVKSVAELGPSAWLETADRGRAQTSLFCLGKNGSIVVVQLFNASAKPDDQAAYAITVAKALQQISA